MRYPSLDAFLSQGRSLLAKGPIAVIFAEDQTEVDSTLRHHLGAGFSQVLLATVAGIRVAPDLSARIQRIDYDIHDEGALFSLVNRLIEAAPGTWFYYCYNSEYLFFPFSESRTVRDLVTFHAEERREAILSYVVDLYATDLDRHENAVCLQEAWMDRSGYYALARQDPDNNWKPKERQLDFFGGLRWRFEEHIPWTKRKIDRISIFRAKPGLVLRPDFTFNDEEFNTYSCPWHHNITTAVASFRTAKALRLNPGSRFDIQSFHWHNSVRFSWHSQQLLDLGLIEPGQWF